MDPVDRRNLTITGRHRAVTGPHLAVSEKEVLVIVTQAFGPRGDNLVGLSDVDFDGFPALTLLVRAGDREELVHLSPIHGDRRKRGFDDLPKGTKCELLCPVTKEPLDKIGPVVAGGDADYCAIYLTPRLGAGSAIYVSDVWGHHHSRIVDNNELISFWAASEEAAAQ